MIATPDSLAGDTGPGRGSAPDSHSGVDLDHTGAVAQALCAEEVRLAYSQAGMGCAVSALVGLLLAWLGRDAVGAGLSLGWAVALLLVTGAGWLTARAYSRRRPPEREAPAWRRRWIAYALACGSVWGLAGILFPAGGVSEVAVLAAFLLAGLSAGSIALHAAIYAAFAAFVCAALGPGVVWLLAGASPLHFSMAGLALLYAVTLLLAGHHYAVSLRRSLSVGLENVGLVEQLTTANATAQDTNRRLESEVSERRQTEEALRLSEERFKDFAETAADWFYETDAALRYTYISERFERISEWRDVDVLGRTQRELLRESMEDPEKLERHFRDLDERRPYQVELLSNGKNGSLHVFHYAGKPIFDTGGRFCGYRGAGRDVTRAYELSKQLSFQANHDALTGLLNRAAFEQRLERVLRTARHDGSTHALCYLDLDQFKVINDTCGHMAGDELLRQLGRMLPIHIRKRDTLARLGGDEFGILMEHCTLEQAERVALGLCRAIEDYQYTWEGRAFRIGCSIGLVPITEASDSVAAILSSADTACYAAKDSGRRRVHVHHPGDEELARRYGEMQWAVRIGRALEEDRLRLVYQPIAPLGAYATRHQLSLLGGDPPLREDGLHFELLLRLEEPDGTLVPPGAFLPAAERYNLAARVDGWVCNTAFDWLAGHPEILERLNLCGINLSGHSLGDPRFLEQLLERLDRGDIYPSRICFEITETAAISNLAAATGFIHVLSERGCLFALDDFGSGLSSFAYLKTLPVQFLKIDGVFVKDIAEDPIDLAMVRSINEIGQVMGKRTVAEFVESAAVLEELKRIGVDYVQGFGVAEPRPIEELVEAVALAEPQM